jgi:hypothetical protein
VIRDGGSEGTLPERGVVHYISLEEEVRGVEGTDVYSNLSHHLHLLPPLRVRQNTHYYLLNNVRID